MKKLTSAMFFAVLASFAANATEFDTILFAKKSDITVSGYAGSTTLANFPVLVRLAANSPDGFNYADCAADGSDLRFADANGDLIPHEIDTWDISGESLVWVSVPSISGTATTFTMYYGVEDVSALPAVTESDVWTGANFNAVWHFSGSNKESANGLTPSVVSTAAPSYTATTFGVGTCFKASANATFGYDVDSKWTTLGSGGTLTVSTWSKYDGAANQYARMVSCMSNWDKPAGWELTQQKGVDEITVGSSGQSQFQYTASGVGPGSGNVYLTVVYNSDGTAQLYVNGALAASRTLNKVATPTEKLYIGSCARSNNRWHGSLDEIRIHRDAESADWVKACYDTMVSASFLTMTAVEAPSGIMPLAIRSTGVTLSDTTATITGRLANLGTGATSADITFYYGSSPDVEAGTAVGPTTYTDKADLSNTLNNLTRAATYYYAYKAVNNAPTPETAWTATNSFVVEASTRFSDTLAIATQNCQMTVTGTMTDWGVGTTKVELLVGTSADNLVSVQTMNLSEEPTNHQVVFDPITNPVGTYVVAIRATTTYNGIEWVRETTTTAQTLVDASTYTWKGGNGDWTNPTMWTSSDTGAGGYPTAGCSVVLPAGDNLVSLPSNPGALAAITIDSAGRHTLRSTSPSSVRSMTAPSLTMSGAGGGTLILDAVSIKGTEVSVCFNTLAGLKRLVLENSAGFAYPREADNSQLELSLVSGGKLTPYWTWDIQVGTLKVGRSINHIAPSGENRITFGGFENIGDLGYCQLSSDGLVAFTDVSGIAQIGGEGTYENNPSQIKVAPEFCFGNSGKNRGIATISNNVVVVLAPETMKQGFDGAGELDNVYVGSATTLTADATVNAVLLGDDLDLGGHTLTVVSGVVRMKIDANGSVKNGTLRVLRPLLVTDNTNNTNERFTAEIVTVNNDDPWAPMLDVWAVGGSKPSAALSNFTGRVIWPFNTFSFKAERTATNYVIDMKTGSVGTSSHYMDYVVRGIAGNCELKTGMFHNTIWVGDCNDDQFAQMNANSVADWGYVVSTNGILAPGYFSYDGGRRGRMFMVSTKERMVNFLMDEGGTLQIAIHADGDYTYLKMSDIDTNYSWSTYINVTLAGTLDIRECGKIQTGVAYPVVFYHPGKRLNDSKFDYVKVNGEASTTYKVEYDVEQPDGSYAVTVTKKGNAGTFIIVR